MTDEITNPVAVTGQLAAASGLGGEQVLPEIHAFPAIDWAPPCVPARTILRPNKPGSFTSGTNYMCQFTLPQDGTYDFRNAQLVFNLTINSAGVTAPFPMPNQFINSIFSRIRAHFNGLEVEDIQNFNLITNIVKLAAHDLSWYVQAGNVLEGAAKNTTDRAVALGASNTYVMPLSLGCLAEKPLPLQYIKQPLYLEFYLADPKTCIEAPDGTVSSITIDSVYIRCTQLACKAYDDMILSKKNSGQLGFQYKSWQYYLWNMTGNDQEINLPTQLRCLEGIIAVMRVQANVSNLVALNKLTRYEQNGTAQYQMRWNGKLYPQEPIMCVSTGYKVPYVEYLRFFDRWAPYLGAVNGMPVMGDDFTHIANTGNATEMSNQQFIMTLDFKAYDSEYRRIVSGVNASGTNTNMAFLWKGTIPGGNASQMEIFSLYTAILKINPNGEVEVLK